MKPVFNKNLSATQIGFYLVLAGALYPVWSVPYFLTGDGPCHVYNSRVLLHFLMGQHLDFFTPFYELNERFSPNWFSHICLAGLQTVFSPETADKLFLSGYVLLFAFGIRYLVKQLNGANLFLAVIGALFVWHRLLQAGFYNYACSLAFFCWVSGYWYRYRLELTPLRVGLLALLWLLLYSAHPIGMVFSFVFVGSWFLTEGVRQFAKQGFSGTLLALKPVFWPTLFAAFPAVVAFAMYLVQRNWGPDDNTESLTGATVSLLNLTALITLNSSEQHIIKVVGYFLLALAITAVVQRVRKQSTGQFDFLMVFAGFAVGQYFYQVGAGSVEMLMPLRLQLVPWLGFLMLASVARLPVWVHRTGICLGITGMCVLLYLRLPVHAQASRVVAEYMGCLPYLSDESVVLALNYDYSVKDTSGKEIATENWLFPHAADYLGAYRPLIMSDNYEALRDYFPLRWNWERNMYGQTDKDGINFDNRPPRADLLSFNRRTRGYNLDYVIILNFDQQYKNHPYTLEINAQLAEAYEQVYASTTGKAVLYRLKKQ